MADLDDNAFAMPWLFPDRDSDDFPEKPRGMHWRTYSRFVQQYERVQSLSWFPFRVLPESSAGRHTVEFKYRE